MYYYATDFCVSIYAFHTFVYLNDKALWVVQPHTINSTGKTARIIIMLLLLSLSHAHTFSRSDNSDIYCSN